jgi:hypothetical protein
MSQHKWEPPISQGEARLREWESFKGSLMGLGLIVSLLAVGGFALLAVGSLFGVL